MTDDATTDATKPRIRIFDTTLRDGEQSPGATMSHDEKLEIAGMLDAMGVDIIEAGFPIASDGDFAAVRAIAETAERSVICGLARASRGDIDRCWEAVRPARSPRIHTFIGTSPLHRAIPNLTMDAMADRIHDTVTHARNLCDNVQWSPMDATRTEEDYLCRVVEIAIRAGATTINIPDTVGYTAPRESAALIAMLREKVVAASARRMVVIADGSKRVDQLGAAPLPVEVLPFAHQFVAARLRALGAEPVLRKAETDPYLTDQGNLVLDCRFSGLPDPAGLARDLSAIPGVLGHGLFLDEVDAVYVAQDGRVDRIERPAA